MTLLQGGICIDGVVLAADRKFTGLNPIYGKKITIELTGILTGFAGDRGNFVLFTTALRKYVTDYLTSKKRKRNILQTPYPDTDSIIWEINQSELRHHKFHVLVAVSGSYFRVRKS